MRSTYEYSYSYRYSFTIPRSRGSYRSNCTLLVLWYNSRGFSDDNNRTNQSTILGKDTLGSISIDNIIDKNLQIFLTDALQVINSTSTDSSVLSLNGEFLKSTNGSIASYEHGPCHYAQYGH